MLLSQKGTWKFFNISVLTCVKWKQSFGDLTTSGNRKFKTPKSKLRIAIAVIVRLKLLLEVFKSSLSMESKVCP